MKAISALILSLVILISSNTGRCEEVYSSELYEEAFVEKLYEYENKLEEDAAKEGCWISKPTSTIKMYFDMNPSATVRIMEGVDCCIYSFTSGNNYFLIVRNNRIIKMWAMNGTKSYMWNNEGFLLPSIGEGNGEDGYQFRFDGDADAFGDVDGMFDIDGVETIPYISEVSSSSSFSRYSLYQQMDRLSDKEGTIDAVITGMYIVDSLLGSSVIPNISMLRSTPADGEFTCSISEMTENIFAVDLAENVILIVEADSNGNICKLTITITDIRNVFDAPIRLNVYMNRTVESNTIENEKYTEHGSIISQAEIKDRISALTEKEIIGEAIICGLYLMDYCENCLDIGSDRMTIEDLRYMFDIGGFSYQASRISDELYEFQMPQEVSFFVKLDSNTNVSCMDLELGQIINKNGAPIRLEFPIDMLFHGDLNRYGE